MYEARSYPLLGLVPIVYRPGDVIRAIEHFQPDVIHHQWPCGTMDLFVHRIVGLGVPVVATIHVAVNSTDFVWDRFFYLHFWWLKRRVAGLSALISISTFVHEQVRERIDPHESRVRLIPSGIDTNVFRPGPAEPDGPLNLLFVGQVMPEKGVDALIEAVRLVSKTVPVTLTIVGDGHLRRSLERAGQGVRLALGSA